MRYLYLLVYILCQGIYIFQVKFNLGFKSILKKFIFYILFIE